jgi:hypothetical protein
MCATGRVPSSTRRQTVRTLTLSIRAASGTVRSSGTARVRPVPMGSGSTRGCCTVPSQHPTRTNRVRVASGPGALTAASDEYAAHAAYVTGKFDAYAPTDPVVSRRLRVQTQYVRPVRWYSRVRCALISQRTVTWAPPVGGFRVNIRWSQRERAIRGIRRVRHCRHRDDASIGPPGSPWAAGRIGHRRVTWRRLDGTAQPARRGVAKERWIEQMTVGCIGYGIHERRKRDGRREACRRRRREPGK